MFPNSSPMETYVNLLPSPPLSSSPTSLPSSLPSPPLLSPPCSEGHDRTELTLPGKQLDLLQTISGAISTPLIVVLMSGGPVDISWAKVTHMYYPLSLSSFTHWVGGVGRALSFGLQVYYLQCVWYNMYQLALR